MIRIVSQDGEHQYDTYGNAITTWDSKKCSWIVEPEYENDKIDWWGDDNDFPAGYTLAEYEEMFPNWREMPDIEVTWTWDEEGYKKQFPDWRKYHIPSFPNTCYRSWGHIEFSEQEAIERLGKYCNFNKFSNTKVIYNGKEIFNGKLD